ncbi:MAG: AgmX/PglI C-terminal domain-containing protein, partial [Chloroflexota bacterium]
MPKHDGNIVDTTLLEEELAPLHVQIRQTREKHEALQGELHVVEAELEKFSSVKERIDALEAVCSSLDKLSELNAEELFWKGLNVNQGAEKHLNHLRKRIAGFQGKISGILEKQAALQAQIDQKLDELDDLNELVRDAHERQERRKEEFVIEREISVLPLRKMIMPWAKDAESDRRFRRAVLVALSICFMLGIIIELVSVPMLDREDTVVEIPKRLAKLVKQEPPRPAPQPEPVASKEKEDIKKPKKEAKPEPEKQKIAKKAAKPKKVAGGSPKGNRKKAEHVGVLAFKNSFADLIDETPVAKLGTDARLSKETPRVKGQAVAQRSLVAMQAKGGTSGSIGLAKFSRNVGGGNGNGLGGTGIGKGGSRGDGAGFETVESGIGNIEESGRPISGGAGPGRTDEEIQIVFDRYKASLYRIYNRELRKDPTLLGKILIRLSIETDGSVSMCKMESTDLASAELVAKVIARVKRFNFGHKKG